jgi:predicted dehydrogenase
MPANSLKIGLIGAGRIGLLHAEQLTSRIPVAELVMVADVFEEAARECAERYDIPYFTQDYHAVLEHQYSGGRSVHPRYHAHIIRSAAGKHIFCEN